MRSMKKLLQRAMVFTLTAAMLVGTPLAASAAPLNGAFKVVDHWGEKTDTDNTSTRTGTVTNTTTSTETGVLKDNEIRILGIVLDKSHVDVVVGGEKETLTATVITDAAEGDLVNKFGEPATNEMMAQLYNMIKWQVLNPDGTVDASTNKVLTIGVVNKGDASQISLNPRQGTKPGEDMIVKASLDGTYYFTPDGVRTELTDNKTDGYSAEATVSIKEYSTGLAFAGVETEQYVKHTLDLSKYIVRTPETANDTITWSSDSKKATVTAAGVVTFKSVTNDNEKITITAVSEKGAKASQEFTVSAGTPATKIEIVPGEDNPHASLFTNNNKKLNLDLGTDDADWADVQVKMYATVKSVKVDSEGKPVIRNKKPVYETKKNQPEGTLYNDLDADGNVVEKTLHITDSIAWKTSKAAIANVDWSAGDWGTGIVATGGALGTAKITATASSGKNASISVIVKASLTDLWIEGIEDSLYSGQSVQLTAGRWHPLNKDAVKWSIKKIGKSANPNATINNKGVLTIKPKLKLDSAYSDKVTVVLETTKAKDPKTNEKFHAEVDITIAQSNINSIKVKDDTANKVIATAEYDAKKKRVVVNSGIAKKDNATNLAVKKGKNYTIEALMADNTSAAQTVDVKTSNAKVADVSYDRNGKARITGIAKGNATVTVSGVREGKAIKTTFKVAVTQPTTSLTIDKTSVVLKATNKKQNVTFKAKQNKGAAEKITWSFVNNTNPGVTINPNNGKVTLAKDLYAAGQTYTVMAKSQSGVAATATIQIVTASAGVRVVNEEGDLFSYKAKKGKNGSKVVNNATVLALGDSVKLYPEVKIGTDWKEPGADDGAVAKVEYSVSKKGIVQIIGNTVYRVGNGSVKITIKTADGKKCTLTIDDIDKLYTE